MGYNAGMKAPQLNLQQIISFYFVAKEGGYEEAAESLFLTRSAVTQQIRSLEVQYGMKFFTVKKHKIHLTTEGERLFAYADEFVHHLVNIESFLKTFRQTTLHLGIANLLMFYMMPVIDRFKELYPTVQVSLRAGKSVDLVDELLKFRHDICFVGQAFVGSATYPTGRLTGYRVAQVEKMVFVASPDYPLSADVESRWEDLAREPLILQSEGSNARLAVLGHFRKRGLSPTIGAEVDDVDAAMELVRQRKGVILTFSPIVRADVAAGRLKVIPVAGGDIRLGIDILLNREVALSTPARVFMELCQDHFGEMFPLGTETGANPSFQNQANP